MRSIPTSKCCELMKLCLINHSGLVFFETHCIMHVSKIYLEHAERSTAVLSLGWCKTSSSFIRHFMFG